MIFTPNLFAFSYLEPGFSPATTKSVSLLTLEEAFPPTERTKPCACARLKPLSSPVKTIVFPVKTDFLMGAIC